MLSFYCERCGKEFVTSTLQKACSPCRVEQGIPGIIPNKWELVEHLNKLVAIAVGLGWDYEFKSPELLLHHYPSKVKVRVDYKGEEFQGFTYNSKNGSLSVHTLSNVTKDYCQERLLEVLKMVARRGHA